MTFSPAPVARRVLAAAIDWASVFVVSMIASIPYFVAVGDVASSGEVGPGFVGTLVLSVVVNLVAVGVYVVMKGSAGGSLGMRVMRTRLVSVAHGGPIGVGRSLLRHLVFSAGSSIVVGLFSPLFHPQQRGWHDLAVGSIMTDGRTAAPQSTTVSAATAPPPPAPAPERPEPAAPEPGSVPAPPAESDAPVSAVPGLVREQAAPPAPPAEPSVISAVPGFERSAPPAPAEQAAPVPAPPAPVPPQPAAEAPAAQPTPAQPTPPPSAPPAAPMPEQVGEDFDATRLAPEPDEDDLDATRVAARPTAVGVLTWDDGTVTTVTSVAVVGRNPGGMGFDAPLLVPITDNTRSLSKTHFAISAEDGGFTVTDLHSTNGVTVRDEGGEVTLAPATPTRLDHGAHLVMGDRSARFEVR